MENYCILFTDKFYVSWLVIVNSISMCRDIVAFNFALHREHELVLVPRKLGRADELLVARLGRVHLQDALHPPRPLRHGDHVIGNEDRLTDVVRDEQDRRLEMRPQPQQQFLHQEPRLVVERAERLVHEQDVRLVDQRARDLDTLLQAARKLVRVVALKAFEADLFHQAQRAGLVLLRLGHGI